MNRPLLSIVIANYNYGRFLEQAIRSVILQGMEGKVELVICDAASTDNSVEIIKKYVKGLPPNTRYEKWEGCQSANDLQLITWWCSEKDGGQSAAFNKGFSVAKGIWLSWLNADDLLLPGALSAFEQLVVRRPDAKWITGNKLSFESETNTVLHVNWGPHCQPPLLSGRRAFSAVFGPTTFFRKSLYEKIGPIDEQLHYAMDTEYWARLTMAGVKQTRLNYLCWGFRIHKASKTTGIQSDQVGKKRNAETGYWRRKTGYNFETRISNIWYDFWILWRVIDGSWFKRMLVKWKLEGHRLPLGGSEHEG